MQGVTTNFTESNIISPVIPFITKYQPTIIDAFEQLDDEIKLLIRTLIKMDNLNILFYGDSGSGKTSIINSVIRPTNITAIMCLF